ncbi:hypothetical protein [Maribacter sp. 2307ULW6-5]|uniref:hypothetical protein n=1 Tax=Maribacter sp. 2307ULW6-5 TaxID=3386275 RepID=UPI0039BD8C66
MWYFPIFLVLAASVYTAQRLELALPWWANNHLNNLLCMPLVLKMCQYGLRYVKSDAALKIPLALSFALTLCYSLYFEVWLPGRDPRYTADVVDVLLYFLGMAFFHLVENYRDNPKPVG